MRECGAMLTSRVEFGLGWLPHRNPNDKAKCHRELLLRHAGQVTSQRNNEVHNQLELHKLLVNSVSTNLTALVSALSSGNNESVQLQSPLVGSSYAFKVYVNNTDDTIAALMVRRLSHPPSTFMFLLHARTYNDVCQAV